MKWHVTHRHELPASLDALGKDYETKVAILKDENFQLKQFQEELSLIKVALSEEKAEKLEAFTQKQQLEQERDKVIMALVVRDQILQDQLNIELPNPLAQ